MLAERLEGKLPNAGALLPLREKILAKLAEAIDRGSFPADAAAHRARCPGGGCRRMASSRSTTACTRSGLRATTAPASPIRLLLDNALGDDGRRPAFSDRRRADQSRQEGAGGVRRWRLHDEFAGEETAVRLGVNIAVLILEDNAYGMIRWKQQADHFADFGLKFGNPDFVAYAESYGAKGTRVRSACGFLPGAQDGARRQGACTSWSCRSITARICACLVEELPRLRN